MATNRCGSGDCVCNSCLHKTKCTKGCGHCQGERLACEPSLNKKISAIKPR